jgi:hypothetical protein
MVDAGEAEMNGEKTYLGGPHSSNDVFVSAGKQLQSRNARFEQLV